LAGLLASVSFDRIYCACGRLSGLSKPQTR
jgi:hypothetical protein